MDIRRNPLRIGLGVVLGPKVFPTSEWSFHFTGQDKEAQRQHTSWHDRRKWSTRALSLAFRVICIANDMFRSKLSPSPSDTFQSAEIRMIKLSNRCHASAMEQAQNPSTKAIPHRFNSKITTLHDPCPANILPCAPALATTSPRALDRSSLYYQASRIYHEE